MVSLAEDEDVERRLQRLQVHGKLADLMHGLLPREMKVLTARFGLETGRERTLADLGEELGLSRERVRGIEANALRKLRHPARSLLLRRAGGYDFLDGPDKRDTFGKVETRHFVPQWKADEQRAAAAAVAAMFRERKSEPPPIEQMVNQVFACASCTNCGALLSYANRLRPGDLSLCPQCAHLMMFSDRLELRNLMPAEAARFAGDPNVAAARRAILKQRTREHA